MAFLNWANDLIIVAWAAFFLYWLISARGVKKIVRQTNPWWRIGIPLLFALAAVFFLRQTHISDISDNFISHSAARDAIGIVFCVAGIAFAIWARRHLGRNWSSTPSVQEGHELVTSGPYRYVRHPIYTGILIAVLGSALVSGLVWMLYFVAICAMFIWRVGVEEKFMTETFPDQYPEYQKRTKALIPFVW